MDDSQLIARIRQNDGNALAEYLQAQRGRMTGLLRMIAGDHLLKVMDLDDLLQEISTSALAALARVPKDDAFDVDAWLDQLARRRVVDAHRRFFGAQKRALSKQRNFSQLEASTRGAASLEQLLIASMTSPSMAVSRNWRLARVQKAMADLGPEQRQILHLRFLENLTTREIAERLKKTDGAIRVMLSRTVKQLEAALNEPQK